MDGLCSYSSIFTLALSPPRLVLNMPLAENFLNVPLKFPLYLTVPKPESDGLSTLATAGTNTTASLYDVCKSPFCRSKTVLSILGKPVIARLPFIVVLLPVFTIKSFVLIAASNPFPYPEILICFFHVFTAGAK